MAGSVERFGRSFYRVFKERPIMQQTGKRNVLLPWFIGIVIVIAADIWVAGRMFRPDCPAPGIAEMIVVIVIPVIYLALMYLTLKSQD
jgi:hypothetical protein